MRANNLFFTKLSVALALTLALGACAGPSQPSRYYVLSVVEPDMPREPDGPAVTLGPVSLEIGRAHV